jgi:hypothetical protein
MHVYNGAGTGHTCKALERAAYMCASAQVPNRRDGEYQRLCQAAVGAYRRAADAMPDEWNYHFYLGKMLAKAGEGGLPAPQPAFLRHLSGQKRQELVRRCLGSTWHGAVRPQPGGLR